MSMWHYQHILRAITDVLLRSNNLNAFYSGNIHRISKCENPYKTILFLRIQFKS